ncbi:hypothetical protein C9374_012089 [Naegleria lovaniensis]|uniref:Protein HIRA n=1 Tax=Naegleria lovaniensis TaxID=51637 RepID=A0AA88GDA7_NAELO|nr:uncharacterized protein C9374_012089 [Naegleria lovaniensis]KAG2373482.1 hypothetical protein C9374_012089 [Naegleria lovaniensis]
MSSNNPSVTATSASSSSQASWKVALGTTTSSSSYSPPSSKKKSSPKPKPSPNNTKEQLNLACESIHWVSTEKSSVFSIDIHPDNTRFATAHAGKICVWRSSNYFASSSSDQNNGSIIANDSMNNNNSTSNTNNTEGNTSTTNVSSSGSSSTDTSNPNSNTTNSASSGNARNPLVTITDLYATDSHQVKTVKTDASKFLIKEITTHSSNVNCVRFSPDGKYLAAASDDYSVSLSKVTKAGTEKEDWKHNRLFKSHQMDVLSVAWSHDSRYLASCSIDNKVIVYDLSSKNVDEPILNSNEHMNHVKGLAFDPIGRYLVSQSENMACIWALIDGKFQLHTKILDQFSTAPILYYRPSFSPCGKYILIPNGFHQGAYCVKIVLREDMSRFLPYKCGTDAVSCAVFNPVIFQKPTKNLMFFACASEDATISIWCTESTEPIARLLHVCSERISDMAWSTDGTTLMASCTDGTVVLVAFEKDYLGKPIDTQTKQDMLQQLYGTEWTGVLKEYPTTYFSVPKDDSVTVTRRPNALGLAQGLVASSSMPSLPSNSSTANSSLPIKNRETSSTTATSAEKQTRNTTKEVPSNPPQQTITTTASGKKRIIPVHTAVEDDEDEDLQQKTTMTGSTTSHSTTGTTDSTSNALNDTMQLGLGSDDTLLQAMTSRVDQSRSVVASTSFGFGQSTNIIPTVSDLVGVTVSNTELIKKRTRQEFTNTDQNSSTASPQEKKSKSKKNKQNQPPTALLATHRDVSTIPTEPLYLKISSTDELTCSLEGTVEYKSNGSIKWKATVSGTGSELCNYPIQAAGTNYFVCICTFPSNQCHVFSTHSGMRLLPPMILDSKVEHLNCCGEYLVVYTLELMFYLWDIKKSKCLVRASVDSLLSNSGIVSEESRIVDDVVVTLNGVGILTLMNGESFAYDMNLKTWICVADSHSIFSPFLSQGRTTNTDEDELNAEETEVTLMTLRNKAARAVKKYKLAHPETATATATPENVNIDIIDDLEMAMTSAAAIGDKNTYLHCVKAYAKHLSKQQKDHRLRDLFNFLLGPISYSPFVEGNIKNDTDWNPYIAGEQKRSVLQLLIVMLISSSDSSIQRMCREYGEILSRLQHH